MIAVFVVLLIFLYCVMVRPVRAQFKVGQKIIGKNLERWQRQYSFIILEVGKENYLVKSIDLGSYTTTISFYSANTFYELLETKE